MLSKSGNPNFSEVTATTALVMVTKLGTVHHLPSRVLVILVREGSLVKSIILVHQSNPSTAQPAMDSTPLSRVTTPHLGRVCTSVTASKTFHLMKEPTLSKLQGAVHYVLTGLALTREIVVLPSWARGISPSATAMSLIPRPIISVGRSTTQCCMELPISCVTWSGLAVQITAQ